MWQANVSWREGRRVGIQKRQRAAALQMLTWKVLAVINFVDVFILKELEGQDRREIPRCQWR
jgi:hypothetical protein